MYNPLQLKGKTAIVTGSSKGIGKAIALAYARAGASVVVSSRNQAAIEEVALGFKTEGLECTPISCHVGKTEERRHLIKKTLETYGGIDILVNNAAVNPVFGPIEETEEAIFDKIIGINLKAVWALSNLVLPHFKNKRSGSIINISSVEGAQPGAGLGIYSVSKAALTMLSKNQAKEWGKYGIRVNAICPGLIKTKFSAALWQNKKILQQIEKQLPLGRMGTPEEMVGLALLLASDAGSYMTGGVYTADGGYLIAG